MRMRVDWHPFEYSASVPWPETGQPQLDWEIGVQTIEHWLNNHVGSYLKYWAWSDSNFCYNIGVAFRWDRDRTLFVITWA